VLIDQSNENKNSADVIGVLLLLLLLNIITTEAD
jgi:hypothetical protein